MMALPDYRSEITEVLFMRSRSHAFTIIEIMVVVSIIALLLGVLLPAISTARDRSYIIRSQVNLRQIAIAHATYAAEWNDNQWTTSPHNLAQFGDDLNIAVNQYLAAHGGKSHTMLIGTNGYAGVRIGHAYDTTVGSFSDFVWSDEDSHSAVMPFNFEKATGNRPFGSYRMINASSFNGYVGGRFYDGTFFAPKDRVVLETLGECYDAPGEFCAQQGGAFGPISSSYILSPAAMFSPNVFAMKQFSKAQMWSFVGVFRAPTHSQARYPDLKTHMLEHHWLQNMQHECNGKAMTHLREYSGCAPYFFNGARDSVPATLFYDGHVRMLAVREVMQANALAIGTTGPDFSPGMPLWHQYTPLMTGGYFHSLAYKEPGGDTGFTNVSGSYHVLTRHGILGRDTIHVD